MKFKIAADLFVIVKLEVRRARGRGRAGEWIESRSGRSAEIGRQGVVRGTQGGAQWGWAGGRVRRIPLPVLAQPARIQPRP